MTYASATYDWVKVAALIDDACASLCDSREHDDPLVHRIWRLGSEALLMTPMPHVDLRDAYKVLPRAVGGPRDLLLRAEELTRAHPIEESPPGASAVIVELIDVIRDHFGGLRSIPSEANASYRVSGLGGVHWRLATTSDRRSRSRHHRAASGSMHASSAIARSRSAMRSRRWIGSWCAARFRR